MPYVRGLRKEDSDEVQGEGSYVVFRGLTYGQQKALRKKSGTDASQDTLEGLGEEALLATFVEWNWKDEQGAALPLPKVAADLEKLDSREAAWLFAHFRMGMTTEAEAKN